MVMSSSMFPKYHADESTVAGAFMRPASRLKEEPRHLATACAA
jgi:hypothetical protein